MKHGRRLRPPHRCVDGARRELAPTTRPTSRPPALKTLNRARQPPRRYVKKYADGKKEIEAEVAELKKHCSVIRVLAHTQARAGPGGPGRRAAPPPRPRRARRRPPRRAAPRRRVVATARAPTRLLPPAPSSPQPAARPQVRKVPIAQKKAHLMEIQVNGGTADQKVDFAYNLLEKAVRGRRAPGLGARAPARRRRSCPAAAGACMPAGALLAPAAAERPPPPCPALCPGPLPVQVGVSTVFAQNEMIDAIAITKGKVRAPSPAPSSQPLRSPAWRARAAEAARPQASGGAARRSRPRGRTGARLPALRHARHPATEL